jgi:hypothetical protein
MWRASSHLWRATSPISVCLSAVLVYKDLAPLGKVDILIRHTVCIHALQFDLQLDTCRRTRGMIVLY